MRIEQSQVALASSRVASTTDEVNSSMQAWVGQRKPSAAISRSGGNPAALLQLSAQAIAAMSRQAAGVKAAAAGKAAGEASLKALAGAAAGAGRAAGRSSAAGIDTSDPGVSDPNLAALIALIERLTGRKVHLLRASDVTAARDKAATAVAAARAAASQSPGSGGSQAATASANASAPQGWGVEVHIEQVHEETETTTYSATGEIVTADGRSINLEFGVAMQRDQVTRVSTDILAGDAARKVDPIALSLDGGPAGLSSDRAGFDLNADGKTQQVALPAAGTYFLALDRNGNGKIDDGSELFGPSSGNGFTELQKLDSDGNGWIDEGDAAFATLRLWSGPGSDTTSLGAAGVGALYVGQSVGTQFDLRSGSNESLGQIVSSSIYVGESGLAGALQQVDLSV